MSVNPSAPESIGPVAVLIVAMVFLKGAPRPLQSLDAAAL
jgi:hypothetical protein